MASDLACKGNAQGNCLLGSLNTTDLVGMANNGTIFSCGAIQNAVDALQSGVIDCNVRAMIFGCVRNTIR